MLTSSGRQTASIRFPGFATLSVAIGLAGIGTSVTRPFLTLFFTDAIHMSPLKIGIFTFANGVGGIVASTWLGHMSDARTPKKDILLVSSLAAAAGYASFLWIHAWWVLLGVSTFLLGIGAATFPQLFAYARESARGAYRGNATAAVSMLRSFFSLAWVLGPLAGTWLLGVFEFNGLFAPTAIVFALLLGLVWFRLDRRRVGPPKCHGSLASTPPSSPPADPGLQPRASPPGHSGWSGGSSV